MSFSDYMDDQTLPREILQHRAWSVPWYREGFKAGIRIALMNAAGVAREKPMRKPEHFRELEKILLEKKHFLMEQAIDGTFDVPGFVRWNHTEKKLEWHQPLTESEAWEIMKAAWEINRHGK